MNPNSNDHSQNYNLPKPQPEVSAVDPVAERPVDESSTAGHEGMPQVPSIPVPSVPIPAVPNPATGSTAASAMPLTDDQLMADDADLIEKEWVNKAKAIVDNTRNDPHLQNKQINLVKADYIKKRYNKDIKVSKD
ncbi:hypothetical protein KA047_02380 [Candidatus Saccharibacteria bacterium]|nr:hypothetical protein [Candidatus Saccharibacteria bacterium]